MSESIFDVIQYVNENNPHRNQLRYDFMRERMFSLIAIKVASFQPKTVIDVGCAYGTLSVFMSKCGLKVKAIDIMPELHNEELFKKHNIDFDKKNIETDSISGKYDVVVLTDVIEHLNYNPLSAMKKLYKICNKGIIITTPARETDYVCEGKWKDEISWRQIPEYTKYEFVDGHHHTYTKWELEDLLSEVGFKIIEAKHLPLERTWIISAEK